MPTYNAGEARLAVVPDASEFKRKLEADMRKIRAEFALHVTADTAQARADIERFREQQQRNGIAVGVDVALAKADAEMTAWRARQHANAVNIRVDVDSGAASAKIAALRSQFSGLGDALSAIVKGGGLFTGLASPGALTLGAGLLPELSSGVGQLSAAFVQLSQSGLLIPGIITSIGASVGTFKLGIDGVGDAFDALQKASDGTPKSIEAAAKALGALAPNAREFVTTVSLLKPKFDELKQVAQNSLFAGLGQQIKTLVDQDFPILQRGIDGIAKGINENLSQALTSLGTDESKGLLDRIFGNTADAQARITQVIDPLITGFGHLAAAGTDALPKLADDFGRLTLRFSNFMETADKDGRLQQWISEGIDGVEHLGSAMFNVGDAVTTIARAADGDLLGSMDRVTERFATWLNSNEGQKELLEFLDKGKQGIDDLVNIAKNVGPQFKESFGAAGDAVGTLLTVIEKITGSIKWLEDHVPGVSDGIKSLNPLYLPEKLWNQGRQLLDPDQPSPTQTSGAPVPKSLLGGNGPHKSGPSDPTKGLLLPGYEPQNGGPSDATAPGLIPPRAGGGVAGRTAAGRLWGPGTPTSDSILGVDAAGMPTAFVSTGEGIVKHAAMQRPGVAALVATLNGYDQGGVVGGGIGGQNANLPWYPWLPIPTGPGTPLQPGNFNPGMRIDLSRADAGNDTYLDVLSGALVDGKRTTADFRHSPLFPGNWVAAQRSSGVPGFAGGSYIDQFGNPVTPGTPPGGPASVAPAPDQGGGALSAFGSFLSGLSSAGNNVLSLAQGLVNTGQQAGGGGGGLGSAARGAGADLSLGDRFAQVPGLFGLFGSFGSSDPAGNLTNWGQQTGQWLGNFTAKTGGGFLSALWQGGLGLVGLDNSILSPTNPWFQDAAQVGQFGLGQDGFLGALFGSGKSGSSSASSKRRGPTDKQIREANDKITDRDNAVAAAQQRLAELPANAKDSTRQSAQNSYDKAVREAAEARDDLQALMSGSTVTSASKPSGLSGNQSAAYQAMLNAGFPPSEWSPLNNILNKESGANPLARNPSSGAFGMFQFLGHENDKYGALGAYSSDPAQQSVAGLQYIKDRYGSPSNAWAFWQANGWYENGGPTPPGRTTAYPSVLHGDEYVISARGRSTVPDSFLHALNTGAVDASMLPGFADGSPGMIPPPRGVVIPPPHPDLQQGKSFQQMQPPPRPPAQVAPPAGAAPTAPASAAPAGIGSAATAAPSRPASVAPVAPAPTSTSGDAYNHNLAAINTGIDSGAAAVGQAIATGIGIASMGAGAAGVPGAGALGGLGSYAAGLAQQGGKILKDVVNVGSSFLVGSVPGSFGTQDNAYGQTLRPAQNVPQTAEYYGGNRTYNMYGLDGRRIVDDLRLQGQQEAQAAYAQWG